METNLDNTLRMYMVRKEGQSEDEAPSLIFFAYGIVESFSHNESGMYIVEVQPEGDLTVETARDKLRENWLRHMTNEIMKN